MLKSGRNWVRNVAGQSLPSAEEAGVKIKFCKLGVPMSQILWEQVREGVQKKAYERALKEGLEEMRGH